MIVGTGVDIIEIERVRLAHRRFKGRFLRRMFTRAEAKYCLKKKDPSPSLAARFAAKEAVVKAFSYGYGKRWKWTDIEVTRDVRGKPSLKFHGVFAVLAVRRKITKVQCSISHSKHDALAMVILETTG